MGAVSLMSLGSHSMTSLVWAMGSLGLATMGGRYSSPCSAKLNGLLRARVVVCGSHVKPVWLSSSLKLPRLCRVAEVRMAPAARLNSLLASMVAAVMGLAWNVQSILSLCWRLIHLASGSLSSLGAVAMSCHTAAICSVRATKMPNSVLMRSIWLLSWSLSRRAAASASASWLTLLARAWAAMFVL